VSLPPARRLTYTVGELRQRLAEFGSEQVADDRERWAVDEQREAVDLFLRWLGGELKSAMYR